jgi:acyl-CoA thioester hydrolase, YbgC/YbaW family
MLKEFIYKFKIYYEHTDAGGVGYYANYLKFFERARSNAIYSLGFSNTDLKSKHDIMFIVKSCKVNYKKPAKFEHSLIINSILTSLTKTSFTMRQTINRPDELITIAEVHLVSVNKNGIPTKIPDDIYFLLKKKLN